MIEFDPAAVAQCADALNTMARTLRKTPKIADVIKAINELGERNIRIELAQDAEDRLLTMGEATRLLGTSENTLRLYIKSGLLPAYTLPGVKWIRVWRSDLMALPQPTKGDENSAGGTD